MDIRRLRLYLIRLSIHFIFEPARFYFDNILQYNLSIDYILYINVY